MKQSHKALLMWVLLILMFVAIWSFFSDVPRSQQVPFSEFITDVRGDKVEWVKIKDGGRTYTYQLKGDPAGRRDGCIDKVDRLLHLLRERLCLLGGRTERLKA